MKPLNKELFVQTLKVIKEGYERRNKFNDAISDICSSWFVCNVGEEWLKQLITLLEYLMEDEPSSKSSSIIDWWLFEKVDKKIWWEENGQKIERDLTTPEALYDYLVEEAG